MKKCDSVNSELYGDSHGSFVIDCPFCGGKKAMTAERDQYGIELVYDMEEPHDGTV